MNSADLKTLAHHLATICEQFGSPRVARLLDECGFPGGQRDDVLCAVVLELRRRGRDGLASAVAAYRFDDKEVA